MISLSQRSQNVTPSSTLAITAKINALIADGVDVVKFGAGEPDFDTPDYIKDAAIAALNAGFTKYTPVPGTPELREAITEKFKRDNGLSYKPSEVIVSCGAKHTLYNIFQAICDPGDEVIFAAPYWVSYPEQVKLAGAVPRVIETTPAQNFCMAPDQIEAAITAKTKAILVNSPSNPTGTTYNLDTLQQIAALAVKHQVYLISDEIYEALLYDGATHPESGFVQRGDESDHLCCQRDVQSLRNDRVADRIHRRSRRRDIGDVTHPITQHFQSDIDCTKSRRCRT